MFLRIGGIHLTVGTVFSTSVANRWQGLPLIVDLGALGCVFYQDSSNCHFEIGKCLWDLNQPIIQEIS